MQRTSFHGAATLRLSKAAAAVATAALLIAPSVGFAQTALTCSPANQTGTVGQALTFTASGGIGTYSWGTPDSSIPNTTATSIVYTPQAPGAMAVVVQSGTQSATCLFTVTGTATGGTTGGSTGTGGLPNTGGGGEYLPYVVLASGLMLTAVLAYFLVRQSRDAVIE